MRSRLACLGGRDCLWNAGSNQCVLNVLATMHNRMPDGCPLKPGFALEMACLNRARTECGSLDCEWKEGYSCGAGGSRSKVAGCGTTVQTIRAYDHNESMNLVHVFEAADTCRTRVSQAACEGVASGSRAGGAYAIWALAVGAAGSMVPGMCTA